MPNLAILNGLGEFNVGIQLHIIELCYNSRVVFLAQTRKTRIIDVVYNASNNELVRTKTLVKNAIVQIDATPFRSWYESHYATPLGRKKGVKLVRSFIQPPPPTKKHLALGGTSHITPPHLAGRRALNWLDHFNNNAPLAKRRKT